MVDAHETQLVFACVQLTNGLTALHAPSSPSPAVAHTICPLATPPRSSSRAALRRQSSSAQRCLVDFAGTTADTAHLPDTSHLHCRPASPECEPAQCISDIVSDRQQRGTYRHQSINVLPFAARWTPHLPCSGTAYSISYLQPSNP